MLMLAITTGLRAIDIVNLKLKDIDWLRGEIRLIQKKVLIPVILPLMPQAGEALRDHILSGRPQCDSEYIFLTIKYPTEPFLQITVIFVVVHFVKADHFTIPASYTALAKASAGNLIQFRVDGAEAVFLHALLLQNGNGSLQVIDPNAHMVHYAIDAILSPQ